MNFNGKILLGDQVVLPKVAGSIDSQGSGSFVLPSGEIIGMRDDYLLELDNGSSIYIRIRGISTSTGVVTFKIQGGWR